MRLSAKVWVLIVVCLWASAGWAAEKNLSRLEEYDLSERCGKQAEVLFNITNRLTNGNAPKPLEIYEVLDSKGAVSDDYRNHYNKKLNKCFVVMEHYEWSEKNKEGHREATLKEKSIYDANEHDLFGRCIIFFSTENPIGRTWSCFILGKLSISDTEWDTLIKPYMEE